MKIDAQSQLSYLRDNIRTLASTSQPLWHPLGFISCVIRSHEKKYTVRLHYWPKNERRTKNPDWPIHTHCYDLSSLILEGHVRDVQYQQKDGSEYTIYSVSYYEQNSAIDRTDQSTSVEPVVDEVRKAGEEYSVQIGVFHQTIVPVNESAVTLVVLSNFGTVDPLVLGAPEKERYPYPRVEFGKLEFWDKVTESLRKFEFK